MTDDVPSIEIIEAFLDSYEREHDYYERVAQMARAKIESSFGASIQCIVTARAKSPERLRDKLIGRARNKPYESLAQIRSDIVDLAGVRVALYFPGDRDKANSVVTEKFNIIETKSFPPEEGKTSATARDGRAPVWAKRFSGYGATHHRGHLRADSVDKKFNHYCNALVEIQVASVLMHAWAEVEHDLAYKTLSGELSKEELSILDEVNGLVLAGEIALERLQVARDRRLLETRSKLRNAYEVADVLMDFARENFQEELTGERIGPSEVLLRLLQKLKLDTTGQLRDYLRAVGQDFGHQPIAEQVIDRIIAEDSARHSLYEELKHGGQAESGDVYRAVGEFVRWWAKLVDVLTAGDGAHANYRFFEVARKHFSHKELNKFVKLRDFRIHVVYRTPFRMEEPEIRSAIEDIKDLLRFLTEAGNEQMRLAAERALNSPV